MAGDILYGPDGSPIGTSNYTQGQSLLVQQTGSKVEQAPGATIPSHGVMTGGSDGTDFRPLKTLTDGTLDTNQTKNISTTINTPVTGVNTLTSVASELRAGSSALANRRKLWIKNLDSSLLLLTGPTTVTQQNGWPVDPGALQYWEFDPAVYVPIYGVSSGASLQYAAWEE